MNTRSTRDVQSLLLLAEHVDFADLDVDVDVKGGDGAPSAPVRRGTSGLRNPFNVPADLRRPTGR
jgi:hypothetical protein